MFGAGGMECLARSTLPKGPIISYVEGGGGKGNTCWKDLNFCKAPPPADHLNGKWLPYFIQYLRDDPPPHPTHTHTYTPRPHISSYMLFNVVIKMHVTY